MTWTNAFDVGECTVKVSVGGDGDLYVGILGKGEGADFNDPGGEHLAMHVGVDEDGIVSLTSDFNASQFSFLGVSLRVIPTASLGDQGIRLSGISTSTDMTGAGACAFADLENAAQVDLAYADDAWSPDPADLSDEPSKIELSAFFAVLAG